MTQKSKRPISLTRSARRLEGVVRSESRASLRKRKSRETAAQIRATRRLESVVRGEAKELDKFILENALTAIEEGTTEELIDQINLKLVQMTTDTMILGFISGRRFVENTVGLREDSSIRYSLKSRLKKLLSFEELREMRRSLEYTSRVAVRGLTGWIRERLNNLERALAPTTQVEESALNIKYRTRGKMLKYLKKVGFNPLAKNAIKNANVTFLHASKNSTIWLFTAEDPRIWGFRYVNPDDEVSRETHADNNGVTLPKDDPFWTIWLPPNGWNCRCTIEVITVAESPFYPVRYPTSNALPDPGFSGVWALEYLGTSGIIDLFTKERTDEEIPWLPRNS